MSDHSRCQNRPVQLAGRLALGPFKAWGQRPGLSSPKGSLARPALEGEPTPVRGARSTPVPGAGPRRPALQSPASREHRGAPPPPPAALAFLSQFPPNLGERLLSPRGCLFLAQAGSGVRGRGRGRPGEPCLCGVTARTAGAGGASCSQAPWNPAPRQPRPHILSARSLSRTLQVMSRVRTRLSRTGLRRPRSAPAGERREPRPAPFPPAVSQYQRRCALF